MATYFMHLKDDNPQRGCSSARCCACVSSLHYALHPAPRQWDAPTARASREGEPAPGVTTRFHRSIPTLLTVRMASLLNTTRSS